MILVNANDESGIALAKESSGGGNTSEPKTAGDESIGQQVGIRFLHDPEKELQLRSIQAGLGRGAGSLRDAERQKALYRRRDPPEFAVVEFGLHARED